jgi:hypothetical protein
MSQKKKKKHSRSTLRVRCLLCDKLTYRAQIKPEHLMPPMPDDVVEGILVCRDLCDDCYGGVHRLARRPRRPPYTTFLGRMVYDAIDELGRRATASWAEHMRMRGPILVHEVGNHKMLEEYEKCVMKEMRDTLSSYELQGGRAYPG